MTTRTPTQLHFTPADHGRVVTEDELAVAEFAEGARHEIIAGRTEVSPLPNLPENVLETWFYTQLLPYSRLRPNGACRVTNKAHVVLDDPELTVPEPDLALYQDIPDDRPLRQLRWQDVSPTLVVEVLVDGDADQDPVRNVALYLRAPSIME